MLTSLTTLGMLMKHQRGWQGEERTELRQKLILAPQVLKSQMMGMSSHNGKMMRLGLLLIQQKQ